MTAKTEKLDRPDSREEPALREAEDEHTDTLLEEIANAVTHGIAAGLAIAALVLLIVQAAGTGNALAVLSVILYGCSLIFMFLVSTLYHSIPTGRTKSIFLAFDHCAIFLLIAGTYTPITLLLLPGWEGWFLFGVQWAMAAGGVFLRLAVFRYLHPGFLVAYLVMGWIGFLFAGTLGEALGSRGVDLILIGGLFYTTGLGFYVWRRFPFNHMLWHLFVLSGAIFHFFAMTYFVLPKAA